METPKTVLDRIIVGMKAKNASDVARKLGLTPASVGAWASDSIPKKETLLRISSDYGVSLHWLLTGEGPQKVNLTTGQDVYLGDDDYGYEMKHVEFGAALGPLIEDISKQTKKDFDDVVKDLVVEALKARGTISDELEPSNVYEEYSEFIYIPLLGYISAGEPIEAIPHEKMKLVVRTFKDPDSVYCLKVRGNSMHDMDIHEGDTLIVRRTSTARNGDVVIALIDNFAATCKEFQYEKGKIRLIPHNPEYTARVYEQERVLIQGVVLEIQRKPK